MNRVVDSFVAFSFASDQVVENWAFPAQTRVWSVGGDSMWPDIISPEIPYLDTAVCDLGVVQLDDRKHAIQSIVVEAPGKGCVFASTSSIPSAANSVLSHFFGHVISNPGVQNELLIFRSRGSSCITIDWIYEDTYKLKLVCRV